MPEAGGKGAEAFCFSYFSVLIFKAAIEKFAAETAFNITANS